MVNKLFYAESRIIRDKTIYLVGGKRDDFRAKDVTSALFDLSDQPIVPKNGGILVFEDGGLLVTGGNEYRKKVLMQKTIELHTEWLATKAVQAAIRRGPKAS